ncbi:cytosolic phospholipase A2 gamma-like [Gadus chalcogrammus]|uniref:cytosolic phospholipase A2 gamma-like n=1 Tax=Gadus chalcogrammus TaxID=1042646 RepID=UPI0024C4AC0B|nr:cytosolic phospholipase A2 gamma-like [Gadus chalcogrammus]
MAQVRIGHSLSKGENIYRSGRKLSVQKWLVNNNIPCSLSKVPNIAILGSGGGERAMVGMLGSLSQMGEQGLLDAALYMSGVSGSTWCMASLYEKANWSSDMKQIKVVAERLGHSSVSLKDKVWKLKKYLQTNDNFSLTDVWAALLVTTIVKKIDESTLSNYQTCHDQDPYPIYTVIDQDCKYEHLLRETFFELTPHEVGYTLAGAFVETSSFGSIFNKGVLTTPKPEMDMTYLQGKMGLDGCTLKLNFKGKNSIDQNKEIHTVTSALCHSFFDWHKDLKDSDFEEVDVFVKTLHKVNEKLPAHPLKGASNAYNEELLKKLNDSVKREELQSHDGPRLILQALKLYNNIIRGEDETHLVDDLNDLLKGKKMESGRDLRINKDEWVKTDLKSRKQLALGLQLDICKSFFSWFPDLKNARFYISEFVEWRLKSIYVWGANYNFLHHMNASDLGQRLLKRKTTHFEDAGLLENSPYMSALRAEREIDLIISFDFSAGNPMETLTETAKECKKLDISFPAMNYTKTDKDFYVFKGLKKAPTVIHIPLFNVANCGSELEAYRDKYCTFQGAYSPEMIEDLMKKAGENVLNNKEKLLREIAAIVQQK